MVSNQKLLGDMLKGSRFTTPGLVFQKGGKTRHVQLREVLLGLVRRKQVHETVLCPFKMDTFVYVP